MTNNNNKLWQAASSGTLHPAIEHYTVGDDQSLDQKLLGYDITATRAHAHMLSTIGIISTDEYQRLAQALEELRTAWQQGDFVVDDRFEDGHSAIEIYLTEQLGDIGKKVHTGRSRNDQALVMMRLYLKDQLQHVATALATTVDAYRAQQYQFADLPMPGYTHTQKAMPTTVGAWLGSYGDAFADLVDYIKSSRGVIDQNPLGSAAGFGVSLPLNRQMTTQELGFAKVQDNPLYCGLSRGAFELIAVQALNPIMVFAGKFASDMILFTTQEFNLFSLPTTMTTGSSIMPHKRNYDVFEIMRARAHGFANHAMQLQAVSTAVGSGYHRDLQLTKQVTISAFETAIETLEVLALCVAHLTPHEANLRAAMTDELYTVAEINRLVERGVPFRDAYRQVKQRLSEE